MMEEDSYGATDTSSLGNNTPRQESPSSLVANAYAPLQISTEEWTVHIPLSLETRHRHKLLAVSSFGLPLEQVRQQRATKPQKT